MSRKTPIVGRGGKVARFGAYRFRDRLPKDGETKAPGAIRAELLTGAAAETEAVPTTAAVYLYDVIDEWGGFWGVSAAEFAEALATLPSTVTELHLHLNSPGGDVYEAVAILNLLRAHPANIVAVVDGIAASAASFLAAGCDSLVMGENSELMIHDAWSMTVGNADDFRAFAAELDRVSDNIASIYAKKAAGTSTEEWRAVMKAEAWYGGEEAVAAKLADTVGTVADLPTGADESTDPDEPREDDSPFDVVAAALRARKVAQAMSRRRAEVTDEDGLLAQALGWFTAIDNIVDQAQATIAAAIGVDNPDTDDEAADENDPAPAPAPSGGPADSLVSRFSDLDLVERERRTAQR